MTKFIIRYLIVTGVLTALVLLFPSLVLFGFLMLFVPGVILAFAPTAFMWGLIFAILYFGCKRRLPRIATPLAFALTGLTVWLVPYFLNQEARTTLAEYHLDNVRSAEGLKPSGDIRLEDQPLDWNEPDDPDDPRYFRTFACRERCLAFLFKPEVTSVTINKLDMESFQKIRDQLSTLDASAVTYRLWPKARCNDGGKNIEFDDQYALNAEMSAAFATKYCLRREASLNRYDLLVRSGEWRSAKFRVVRDSAWSMPWGMASANFADVVRADRKVLFRQFNLSVRELAQPLYIAPLGGITNFRLGWGVRNAPSGVPIDYDTARNTLDKFLNSRPTDPYEGGAPAWRKAIRNMLANKNADFKPRNDQEILQSAIKSWTGQIFDLNNEDAPLNNEDFEFLKELLADPRVYDLRDSVSRFTVLSDEQQRALQPLLNSAAKRRPAPELKNAM